MQWLAAFAAGSLGCSFQSKPPVAKSTFAAGGFGCNREWLLWLLQVELVVTDGVRREAQQLFGCPDLEGAQMEDEGGPGSAGSHWLVYSCSSSSRKDAFVAACASHPF